MSPWLGRAQAWQLLIDVLDIYINIYKSILIPLETAEFSTHLAAWPVAYQNNMWSCSENNEMQIRSLNGHTEQLLL